MTGLRMNEELKAWRAAGKHLPEFLKDFHDQKDVFCTMHEMLGPPSQEAPSIHRPDWVEGQCYVIDCFLWFMARHGYTLQKSRAKLEFDSLPENIAALRAEQRARFDRAIGLAAATPTDGNSASQK
jgi:hypothetical protein